MNTHWVGESALLIDTQDAQDAQRLRLEIGQSSIPGLRELVPGLNSLLVEFDALGFDVERFMRLLPKLMQSKMCVLSPREHQIMVCYNGEDLGEVSQITGLSIDEVIRRHSAAVYRVAFLGFAPGFPYLTGLDTALRVPRLKTPRTKVVAGAVAIADEFGGIYPRATPGGWRILGYTAAVLFEPQREPPALLAPGDLVRFRPQA